MNLRDLEYLVALEEEKHFRKAAERCFVSQPTLSGQLRKLEDELGVILIERTSRKVLFTPAGDAMAKELQDFVKSTVAPYKYPRALEFVEQLPRTATGKLQRFRLHSSVQ